VAERSPSQWEYYARLLLLFRVEHARQWRKIYPALVLTLCITAWYLEKILFKGKIPILYGILTAAVLAIIAKKAYQCLAKKDYRRQIKGKSSDKIGVFDQAKINQDSNRLLKKVFLGALFWMMSDKLLNYIGKNNSWSGSIWFQVIGLALVGVCAGLAVAGYHYAIKGKARVTGKEQVWQARRKKISPREAWIITNPTKGSTTRSRTVDRWKLLGGFCALGSLLWCLYDMSETGILAHAYYRISFQILVLVVVCAVFINSAFKADHHSQKAGACKRRTAAFFKYPLIALEILVPLVSVGTVTTNRPPSKSTLIGHFAFTGLFLGLAIANYVKHLTSPTFILAFLPAFDLMAHFTLFMAAGYDPLLENHPLRVDMRTELDLTHWDFTLNL